ncbi:MAG: hypothetical protein RIR11_2511 [Bacteroidota bacterium]|jgi:hypothetical protein
MLLGIKFCANIQLSPSVPITELAYCRGAPIPDNFALTPIEPTFEIQLVSIVKSFSKMCS